METNVGGRELPEDHFVAVLGMELWIEDGRTHGSAPLRPSMWGAGTEQPRTGLLATMVDMVAGNTPDGPVNPTIDLRIQIVDQVPPTGEVHLVCHPLKVGRRLIVAETRLYGDDPAAPFAIGTTTFMNELIDMDSSFGSQSRPVAEVTSFDELLGHRVVDDRSIEVDPSVRIGNGPGQTVQGGVQATLAELAAEHVVGRDGPVTVTDLDIRYLNRVKVGPLRATAEVVGAPGPSTRLRVALTDAGDDGRIVAHVALTTQGVVP